MKCKLALHVIFALFVCHLAVISQDKTTDDTIKIKTDLVSVPVIVSDRDGRYVPDLKQTDFRVLQDGAVQSIAFFASTEEPVNVALLLDTSGSTRSVIGDIKGAANKFLKQLGPADKAMIVSFDYSVHLLSPLTADKDVLKDAIHEADVPDERGTALRDAVADTIQKQFAGVTGRKAIILLTDGIDHGSRTSVSELASVLEESDVIVYSIFFHAFQSPFSLQTRSGGGRSGGGTGNNVPKGEQNPTFSTGKPANQQRRERTERENQEARDLMRKISEMTAGRFYESQSSKLKDVFDLILDELRHQYRLGYYPPEESVTLKVHMVRVGVMRSNLSVRARLNYRSGAK